MGDVIGRVLRVDGADAAAQMAIDEALARSPQDGPVLRLYRWQRPAISWGYFVKADPGIIGRPGWELVRRPTGGGVVEHGEDVTYTLILPRSFDTDTSSVLSMFQLRMRSGQLEGGVCQKGGAAEAFAAANQLVLNALQLLNVQGNLATETSSPQPFYCATQPVAGDVLVGGRKVAGCAARRLRRAMLLQGYVDLPRLGASVTWSRMAGAMQAAASTLWPVAWRTDELTAPEIVLADELAERRYRTEAWNYPQRELALT